MRKDQPKFLYKYLRSTLTTVLSEKHLRYSPISTFNDIFEGRPKIVGINTMSERRDYLRPYDNDAIDRMLESLPKEVRPFMSMAEIIWLTEHAATNTGSIDLLKLESVNELGVDFITRKIDEKLGILCLSEVPDNLLMWSHYCDKHEGFVMEFDAHHRYFNDAKSDMDDFRHVRRVQYRDVRPKAYLAGITAAELFLIKSSHWSYELEWRIVRPLGEATCTKSRDEQGYPIHLFKFPSDAVTSVILGAKASQATISSIKKIINEDATLSHVKIKQVLPDASHFLLHVTDLEDDGLMKLL